MKFNLFTKGKTKTSNFESAIAYSLSPENELYTAVVTSVFADSFYEKENDRLERIKQLIKVCRPEYVVKLAVYARTQMHLRTTPLVLMVELAKVHSGDNLISRGVFKVIQRADEITELLSYYQLSNRRLEIKKLGKMSKQLQKGIALSFNKFDEYQFAKYNRKTEVSLKDALFLAHPKALCEDQQKLFNKIVMGNLAVPYTWETELSALGQKPYTSSKVKFAAYKEKWEELITSGKLGYMALLRNLRNILEAQVSDEVMELVCQDISNEFKVAKSKQLPFRFLAAYRELKQLRYYHVSKVLSALELAIRASAQNIKGYDGNFRVTIACDVSSSMQKCITPKSSILLYDIGLVLAMLLQSRCRNVVKGMFGNTWKIINMPRENILQNVGEFYTREGEVGYSTNGYKVVDDLIYRNVVMDKVLLFTDAQLWNSSLIGSSTMEKSWRKYKANIAPKAKLYLFDLAGYGNTPLSIKDNDVYLISGWSDKVFDVLHAFEEGRSALDVIEKIEI